MSQVKPFIKNINDQQEVNIQDIPEEMKIQIHCECGCAIFKQVHEWYKIKSDSEYVYSNVLRSQCLDCGALLQEKP